MIPKALTLSCLLVTVLLNSCGTEPASSPVKGSESARLVYDWQKRVFNGLDNVKSPAGLDIPIVVFMNPGAGFSPERWNSSASGNYSAHRFKDDRLPEGDKITLRIFGSPEAAPVLVDAPAVSEPAPGGSELIPREWLTVRAPGLDRNIRYYFLSFAMGDTNDTWESEIFTVRGADGKVSSYKASIESTDGAVVAKLFSRLAVR